MTPSQAKCKKPRIVNYKDDHKKQSDARDIIMLYVGCGLGYTPIRLILNLPNDKLIEDVVRQHMIGRNDTDDEIGELYCPPSKHLSPLMRQLVKEISIRHDTLKMTKVAHLVETGNWPKKVTCVGCGREMNSDFSYCPYCGNHL